MDPLQPYFDAIQRLDSAEGTEHTLRGALENLLKAIAAGKNSNITVIHEPKRDKTKPGAPDFKAKFNAATAGYLKSIPQELNVDVTPGDFQVETPAYDAQREQLHINTTQYCSPMPQDVWKFHIGGYQVLNQYLKSRKGHTLSLDEIENIQNVVNVLRFTINQMQRIEERWEP